MVKYDIKLKVINSYENLPNDLVEYLSTIQIIAIENWYKIYYQKNNKLPEISGIEIELIEENKKNKGEN